MPTLRANGQRVVVGLGVAAILAISCGDSGNTVGTADPTTSTATPETPLTDIVLRLADYPVAPGMGDPADVQVDFDALDAAEGGSCPQGIASTEFTEGVITGDPGVVGDPEAPPFAGFATVAARVSSPAIASRWLDEWVADSSAACVRANSNVGGEPTVIESAVGNVRVVRVDETSADVAFHMRLFASNTTVAILVAVDVGDAIDDQTVEAATALIAQRMES